MTSIPKISVQANINAVKTSKMSKLPDAKNDSFQKNEKLFDIDTAMKTLAEMKEYSTNKFKENDLTGIKEQLTQYPEKWEAIQKLSNTKLSGSRLSEISKIDTDSLNKVSDIVSTKDFLDFNVTKLAKMPATNLENARLLSETALNQYSIVKMANENLKSPKKLVSLINDAEKSAGNKFAGISVDRNPYDKESYIIKVNTTDLKEQSIVLDKNYNRQSLEEKSEYKTQSGKKYTIKKAIDFRTNTVSKSRIENNKDNLLVVTNEIRILKDKNGKVKRTEYTEKSDVEGVYNVKHVYPNGKVDVVSSASVDSKTGITTVKKNMVSLDGTRTEVFYEDDPQGNRISDYKITDKNGKVLLNNNLTFEVVSENKFISSKNDEKFEITLEDKNINVKDLKRPNKEDVNINLATFIKGSSDKILETLKSMPGEELVKMSQAVAKLDTYAGAVSSFNPLDKTIKSNDNLFVVLHELGHATDLRDIGTNEVLGNSKVKGIFENEDLSKTYEMEKANFNKQFPNAQKDNIEYFINHETHYNKKSGGLMETVAETNAILTTPKASEILALRAQYLQQHFPRTIAKLDKLLNTYNEVEGQTFAQKPIANAYSSYSH